LWIDCLKSEVPAARGRDFKVTASVAKKLGSATLTVVFFVFVLALSALFLRILAGLLAGLARLSRLTTLLALSALVAWLILFLHIVCHDVFLLRKRGPSHAFGIYRH
jgi:hypothetical protein